jgi:hypothetical protein
VWSVRLGGIGAERAEEAVRAFLAAERVEVQRMTKNGLRTFDAREAVLALEVEGEGDARAAGEGGAEPCAILRLVVRHLTPAVRPDDVLSGLRQVADLAPPGPVAVTRLAQGPLDVSTGAVGDPLAPDRAAVAAVPDAVP